MGAIVEIVFQSILYVLSLTLCLGLITDIIPRYLFGVEYFADDNLGRGLKKMTYPGGRAVSYEPHPRIRKYVNKYLLFTMDGYKYLQSKIGDGVNRYTASVICFDRNEKVIDVLDVAESVTSELSHPIKLHHKTSHIAFILTSVNGKMLPETVYMRQKLSRAPLYTAAVSVTVFLQFLHLASLINNIYMTTNGYRVFTVGGAFFLLPSLAIGALCFGVTLLTRVRKGVKVVRK